MDSWYTPPSGTFPQPTTTLALHTDFEEADASHTKHIEALLEKVAVAEISHAQAIEIAGRPFAAQKGKKFFAIRSLRFSAHGAYAIETSANSIRIHHSSLGFDAPIVRRGVVVLLDRQPQNVYVTCSMAR